MGIVKAFCRGIDVLNEWLGKLASILIVPIVLITTIEVVARYVFNSPTIWAWDTNVQLMAFIAAIGAGYTLLYRGHVIMDIFIVRLSLRKRAILDLLTAGFFFLGVGIVFWRALLKAQESVATKEMVSTIWGPPIYPLRVIIVIGVATFLLQGLVKFIRDIAIVSTGKEGTL